MDLVKFLSVLVVLFVEGGESGGHGGKHNDHVKLHIPEFIHHDHHTKVITVHHHHQKPKKEQHHHHHHHHKPAAPQHGHHHHQHHKKTTLHTTTVSKGHKGHHGHHSPKSHGHYGHHGHEHHLHGHHGHGHGHHHHDTPSYSYDPIPPVSSFEDDFGSSFTPSVPSISGNAVPQVPRVHGITHTVQQTQVYDTLPGALPSNAGNSHGYQVTEEGAEEDDDVFTSVHQAFPESYGYLRGAAAEQSHDPFAAIAPQSTHDASNAFAASPHSIAAIPSAETFPDADSFVRAHQNVDEFVPSISNQNAAYPSAESSPELPVSFHSENPEFDIPASSFAGTDDSGTAFFADENSISDNYSPINFNSAAGIHQSIKTDGIESVVY